jgi:Mrp family chromosome partitioning ATPase
VSPLGVAYHAAITPTGQPAAKRFAAELIAFHQPEHPVSEQYGALLDQMNAASSAAAPTVVLLVGVTSRIGTTTVLLNLAITRARKGTERVVVVDGNLRRPALAERLGLAAAPGLHEAASKAVPVPMTIQETGLPRLWAMTAGAASSPTAPWPLAKTLSEMFNHLREHFDCVLVDAPSWDDGPEMVALASACQAVYLVVRPGDIETPPVAELGRLIPRLDSHLAGYILTQR